MRVPSPRWIAHRGGGNLAPENTLAGIRLAARLGFQAVEFDVMLSSDGTPVLFHDETLERTTNGRGLVAETPDCKLFSLDAGGEPVPTLLDAAALCRDLGLFVHLELKPSAGRDRETAERALAVAARIWPETAPALLISSFSLDALRVAQARQPDWPRAWLLDVLPDDWLGQALALEVDALHLDLALVTPHLVRVCAEHELAVRCYTLHTPALAAYLSNLGVAGFFVDPLDRFSPDARNAGWKMLPGCICGQIRLQVFAS